MALRWSLHTSTAEGGGRVEVSDASGVVPAYLDRRGPGRVEVCGGPAVTLEYLEPLRGGFWGRGLWGRTDACQPRKRAGSVKAGPSAPSGSTARAAAIAP